MKQVSKKKPATKLMPGEATSQLLSKFALAQTRARLKRVAREIERATEHPGNPETAHDLRVAIRRFTQCLRTFDQLLEPRPVKKMRKTLRKLMDLCGAKRDFDVGLQVLADAGLPADHPAFARFQEHREPAMHALERSLQKKHKWAAIRRWETELMARNPPPGVVRPMHSEVDSRTVDLPGVEQPVEWIASAGVRENVERVLPRLAKEFFDEGNVTANARGKLDLLHPFRLRGKRFRYTLEVFAPCYGEGIDAKIRDLRGLQDRMGQVNDCLVVLKLPGMNRSASTAVRKLLAARDADFRKYWSRTFSRRSQESWGRLLSNPPRAMRTKG